jgi:hypothetical protein
VSGRPIRVVLDTSAIIAYTRESINVGEVFTEVDEESAAFGLPVLCLVEASRTVADDVRFELLLTHPACEVLSVEADNWKALVATNWIVGRIDAASAALAAIDNGCYTLTGQPGQYDGVGGRAAPYPEPERSRRRHLLFKGSALWVRAAAPADAGRRPPAG